MGRPSTLTQDKIDMICQWLHAGYFVEDAARMAKVPKSTFYSWMEKGKEHREAGEDTLYTAAIASLRTHA